MFRGLCGSSESCLLGGGEGSPFVSLAGTSRLWWALASPLARLAVAVEREDRVWVSSHPSPCCTPQSRGGQGAMSGKVSVRAGLDVCEPARHLPCPPELT